MSELKIIGGPQSNFVWLTRIACSEKGVPYTLVPVFPHTPEVDAIHPVGKIPVLQHGDVTLAESRAICVYIDRVFDGPSLIPSDPVDAARTEQWISIVNTHVDPVLMRQYVAAHYFPDTADGEPDRKRIDGLLEKMEAQFAMLERAVAQTGHLVNGSFTLADANLLPILFYMNKLPESRVMLGQKKQLKAYLDRHLQRKSVAETIPPPMPGRSE